MGVDAKGNKDEGAGDQGIMFGYADSETPVFMPSAITYARMLMEKVYNYALAHPAKLGVDIKVKGYPIPKWNENIVIQKNNVYFVGDAAGQVMPFTFEGIFYSIYSAKILAKSIIYNLDYKKEWEKVFLKKYKFMKFLETINNTPFRKILMRTQKLSFVNKWSVNFWQKEKIN